MIWVKAAIRLVLLSCRHIHWICAGMAEEGERLLFVGLPDTTTTFIIAQLPGQQYQWSLVPLHERCLADSLPAMGYTHYFLALCCSLPVNCTTTTEEAVWIEEVVTYN